MTPLFKKMNLKDHAPVYVLNAPESFTGELEAIRAFTETAQSLDGAKDLDFALVFATRQEEVDAYAEQLSTLAADDPLLWFAYPKKSSKNFRCEFDRDTGWELLGKLGYEPVRIVAVDADWSALRFRKVGHIKKITRRKSMALTREAKERTINKKQ